MIDKERILMALLTQIYAKAMYAPMSTDKWKRMQPPLFEPLQEHGNECTLGIRKKFQDEKLFEVKFKTSSKTTIKSITELIEEGAKNYETV